jgi:CheY-like chemotaxis protein
VAQILVVDDDPRVREWLAEVLTGAGHRVFTAQDGLEARSLAMRHALEVVITDISMPNEEGLGMIRALHKALPQLKIIALSGQDPETLLDARLLGADAALRKPVASKIVLQCVCDLSPSRAAGQV